MHGQQNVKKKVGFFCTHCTELCNVHSDSYNNLEVPQIIIDVSTHFCVYSSRAISVQSIQQFYRREKLLKQRQINFSITALTCISPGQGFIFVKREIFTACTESAIYLSLRNIKKKKIRAPSNSK